MKWKIMNYRSLGVLAIAIVIAGVAGFAAWLKSGDKLPDQAVEPASTTPVSAKKASADFYNPIVPNGADPWIYKHTDGYYYFTKTTGNNVTLWKSKTITSIDAGEKKVVWTPPPTGPNSKNIWAPEIHFLNGKWYIYFAADGGKGTGHYMFVLESETSDAFGKYKYVGQITDPSKKRAIDGTVLKKSDGSLYFVWSGWEGEADGQQNLYIAPMSNPYTISGDRVEISRPSLPWERNGLINEGPEILMKNNKIMIIYSASGSWTDDYCLGMLTADMNSDVLQPSSWKKSDKPLLSKANGVYGPGHNGFTTSPDGKEDWIIYHAAKYKGGGWDRDIRAQKFTWNADGTPNFGAPLSKDSPVPLPSGEFNRDRYEAEQAVLSNAAVESQPAASGGKKVTYLKDNPAHSLEFTVNAPSDGTYDVVVRFGNGNAGKGATSTYGVTINGTGADPFRFVNLKLWNNWSTQTMKVRLKAGTNTIRLSKVLNFAEFDYIELIPAP